MMRQKAVTDPITDPTTTNPFLLSVTLEYPTSRTVTVHRMFTARERWVPKINENLTSAVRHGREKVNGAIGKPCPASG